MKRFEVLLVEGRLTNGQPFIEVVGHLHPSGRIDQFDYRTFSEVLVDCWEPWAIETVKGATRYHLKRPVRASWLRAF